MIDMNYFVEGLQGSGKSTLVGKLARKYPDNTVFREGDDSPTDLAWCAYVTDEEYQSIIDRYSDIRGLIEEKSHTEDDHKIICYTQVITDIPGFHKYLEQYECVFTHLKPHLISTDISSGTAEI